MARPLPFSIDAAAVRLRDSTTFGFVLLAILLPAYGEELFDTDPVEIYARIEEDFRASLTEDGENKLNAITMAVSTDAFYEDPQAMVSIVKALNTGDLGDLPDGYMEETSISEILWAIYEVGMARDDDKKFDPPCLQVIDRAAQLEAQESTSEETPEAPPHEEYLKQQKIELASQLASIGMQLSLKDLR